MIIVQKEWYSVEQCLNNPQNLYVFGDNTIRVGKGGQAQIRDCANSFGIATKRYPTMEDNAFFIDDDSMSDLDYILADIEELHNIKDQYENIVFPYDGLGTGLSKMPTSCPLTFQVMNRILSREFGFNNV